MNASNQVWFTGTPSVDIASRAFGLRTPTQGNLPRFLELGLNLHF